MYLFRSSHTGQRLNHQQFPFFIWRCFRYMPAQLLQLDVRLLCPQNLCHMFYQLPEHDMVTLPFLFYPTFLLRVLKKSTFIQQSSFPAQLHPFLPVSCPACSAAVLFKQLRILFKRNLFVPVKSSPSGNNIFSFRKPCLLQLLSDIINQTVDRMVRIVQCPSTKQNLLQMFPADSLFSAMEKQLQYLCKLRLFFLLCDQRSPLIFQGKITEHFYIQNLLFLRYFVLHTRSTCLHTFVCSLLRQPLS